MVLLQEDGRSRMMGIVGREDTRNASREACMNKECMVGWRELRGRRVGPLCVMLEYLKYSLRQLAGIRGYLK